MRPGRPSAFMHASASGAALEYQPEPGEEPSLAEPRPPWEPRERRGSRSDVRTSAADQLPRAVRARVVSQAVVREDRLFVGRGELAIGADRGGVPDQLPVVVNLEVSEAHGGLVQGHEHQPVTGRPSEPNGGERWKVGAWVDVDRLQFPDLVPFRVGHDVAVQFPGITCLEHADLLLSFMRFARPLAAASGARTISSAKRFPVDLLA